MVDVAVIGAGSWGTAVASLVARSSPTRLWARSAALADQITSDHRNEAYLPGLDLPEGLAATADLRAAAGGAEIVLLAVPSHGLRAVMVDLAPHIASGCVLVILTKGIEAGTNSRMSEIVAEVLPGATIGVLTGPNLAREVAEGQPAASVVAVNDEEQAVRVQEALHSSTYRVYTSNDVIGCEVAGAAKNVIAIAAGMGDGLGFGENTRAALITRGLSEVARVGTALGGEPLTFGGLAGVGDLVATCTSARSRNRSLGLALGAGQTLAEALAGTHMVAEGVRTAGPLVALAAQHGVEIPIAAQVAAIVAGTTTPRQALVSLMGRPARREWDVDLLRDLLR
ncbi:MAG TPA: NAD(P)H-dependent glycerol-3-phosphate dehydrogenase [Acidimicrobiales bacterium]|nr:NAD(P)H-dependent glycerol-3-phosphate dehydrogenase [Acidimicrobiales bacterium]